MCIQLRTCWSGLLHCETNYAKNLEMGHGLYVEEHPNLYIVAYKAYYQVCKVRLE